MTVLLPHFILAVWLALAVESTFAVGPFPGGKGVSSSLEDLSRSHSPQPSAPSFRLFGKNIEVEQPPHPENLSGQTPSAPGSSPRLLDQDMHVRGPAQHSASAGEHAEPFPSGEHIQPSASASGAQAAVASTSTPAHSNNPAGYARKIVAGRLEDQHPNFRRLVDSALLTPRGRRSLAMEKLLRPVEGPDFGPIHAQAVREYIRSTNKGTKGNLALLSADDPSKLSPEDQERRISLIKQVCSSSMTFEGKTMKDLASKHNWEVESGYQHLQRPDSTNPQTLHMRNYWANKPKEEAQAMRSVHNLRYQAKRKEKIKRLRAASHPPQDEANAPKHPPQDEANAPKRRRRTSLA